jgi:hypothetical protein
METDEETISLMHLGSTCSESDHQPFSDTSSDACTFSESDDNDYDSNHNELKNFLEDVILTMALIITFIAVAIQIQTNFEPYEHI